MPSARPWISRPWLPDRHGACVEGEAGFTQFAAHHLVHEPVGLVRKFSLTGDEGSDIDLIRAGSSSRPTQDLGDSSPEGRSGRRVGNRGGGTGPVARPLVLRARRQENDRGTPSRVSDGDGHALLLRLSVEDEQRKSPAGRRRAAPAETGGTSTHSMRACAQTDAVDDGGALVLIAFETRIRTVSSLMETLLACGVNVGHYL